MCGIVAISSQGPVNQALTQALTILQHRGQDAAGILTSDGRQVYLRKDKGLVRDVIRDEHITQLKGNLGLGHVRYPTAGSFSGAEAQPLYVNSPYGLSIVHNGNLINDDVLAGELREHDFRHLNTLSDSEVLLNIFAYELQKCAEERFAVQALFSAAEATYARVIGAFSAVILIHGHGLLALRDKHGIRPMVFGERLAGSKKEYMVASESVALDALGYTTVDDVAPGEAIFFPEGGGPLQRHICVKDAQLTPCLFEYIYLARPDSIIDGISVHLARLNMGKALAKKMRATGLDNNIDVVIPIPDTSRTAALALAQSLNLPYTEGFVKNRYVARTFIMPEQETRRSAVRLKLNAMASEFAGKNVLLVDDSIVRGTTSKEIIQMAREAGAKSVCFACAAPAIRYPNVYGIDMPVAEELIAHAHVEEDIAKKIGADRLIYQDLPDVIEAVLQAKINDHSQKIEQFEDAVFTGQYVTGGVDQVYLDSLAARRKDQKKKQMA